MRVLRLLLVFAAVTWGAAGVGVFLDWSAAAAAMVGLGAAPIQYDPMLDYWLRMASGAFGLLGCWYLTMAIWPLRFADAIPWFGLLLLLEGAVLFVHGVRLQLPPFPFFGDVVACIVGGVGILLLFPAARPRTPEPPGNRA